MFKRQINQRGGLVLMELGILAVLLVTIGAVLTQVHQVKSTKSNASQSAQHKSGTRTTTTPENTNTNRPFAGSGIKGQIYQGAGTGCYSLDPNSACGKPRPQAGTVVIKGSNGTIQTVKSNSSGYFMVNANPGTYTVDIQTGGAATTVEVKAGVYTEIVIYAN